MSPLASVVLALTACSLAVALPLSPPWEGFVQGDGDVSPTSAIPGAQASSVPEGPQTDPAGPAVREDPQPGPAEPTVQEGPQTDPAEPAVQEDPQAGTTVYPLPPEESIIQVPVWNSCPRGEYRDSNLKCRKRF